MTAPAGTLAVPAPLTTGGFSAVVAALDARVLAHVGDVGTYQANVAGAQPVVLRVALDTGVEDAKNSPVLSKTPTLTVDVPVADVPNPRRGDRFTVGLAMYTVQHKIRTDLSMHTVAVQFVGLALSAAELAAFLRFDVDVNSTIPGAGNG